MHYVATFLPITMWTHAEIFINLVFFGAIFAMACIAKMAEKKIKSTKMSACVNMFTGSLLIKYYIRCAKHLLYSACN